MPDTTENLAYDRIKTAIIKRYIKQGSKLVEATVAKQLGISRTPVRGALKRLAYEGFVEFIPNKGAYVIEPTIEEIKQTFAVRAQLEKMAAALAAERISDADIEELHRLIEEEDRVFKEGEVERYYEVNDAIHLKIAQAADNAILYKYVNDLLVKTKIFLILFDPFRRLDINPSPIEHSEIVQYLKNRDAAKAEAAMETHLKSALDGMDMKRLLPEDYLAL